MVRADAQSYSDRWGAYAELRRAAQLFGVINAIYGPKRDITEHLAVAVLKEMAAATDEARLQDLVNYHAQRAAPK